MKIYAFSLKINEKTLILIIFHGFQARLGS